jgi:hypothetical protein
MEKKKRDDTAAEPVLVTAAEKIGHAAGKIASLLGVKAAEPPPTPSKRKPKLPKRDKHRLPRRQKKTQQKAASREQAASKR